MSSDFGDSWEHLNVPSNDDKSNYPVTCLEICKDGDNIYLYATLLNKGVYRSDDEGQTWNNITENVSFINEVMTSSNNNMLISACKSYPNVLYLIVVVNGRSEVMAYTEDFGSNWNRLKFAIQDEDKWKINNNKKQGDDYIYSKKD